MRRRLTSAGYGTELVEGAIEKLTGLGILDDETFATVWIESRDRARPRGQRGLRAELARKGIDRAVIEAILARRAEATPGADLDAAVRLLARHARTLERVDDPRVRRQRAYALLARNGFEPDLALEAIRRTS